MRTIFIEYDRTRRVDKNFEKFRRYDTFLCWWSHFSEYRRSPTSRFRRPVHMRGPTSTSTFSSMPPIAS
ncbi:MAG: hypothetical protein WKF40_04925 [Thermoleophilaceae bacterium]